MGDIADMMLDGTLCEGCGGFMGGEAEGIPRYCSKQCEHDRADKPAAPKKNSAAPKVPCAICNRRVKTTGIADHMRAVHGSVVAVDTVTQRPILRGAVSRALDGSYYRGRLWSAVETEDVSREEYAELVDQITDAVIAALKTEVV